VKGRKAHHLKDDGLYGPSSFSPLETSCHCLEERKSFMPEVINTYSFRFYGTLYVAYYADDRNWYLSLAQLCDGLGLDRRAQQRRVQEHEAISDLYVTMVVDTPYKDGVRKQDVGFLNLEALPFWLGMIETARVKEDIRPRITLYQRDFVRTAWMIYRPEILPAEFIAEMDATLPEQERNLFQMASEFQAFRRKVEVLSGHVDDELAKLGLVVGDLDDRFKKIEAKVLGEETVNSAQAQQLSEMIKAVAEALWQAEKFGRSEAHAKTQLDFKNHFGVHLYSALPANRMVEAIDYLAGRWHHLNPGKPFPDIFKGGHQPSLI